MREPAFWWRPLSWPSLALAPFGSVYGLVAASRLRREGADPGLPVICVGNYHVGGAGKTPTVIALTRLLTEAGARPFVLSRGYGGSLEGPVQVDQSRHGAGDVGDEPMLLAAAAPTIVSRDRVACAHFARQQGASVIVMDDGFQNPSLKKHLSLIVVDSGRGIGNGMVFPAGPLRAPLAPQLARTDGLVIVGNGSAAAGLATAVTSRGGLVLRARFVPDQSVVAALAGRRVLAFAGIGDPERFFATLRSAGIEVAATHVFADHHKYQASEIAALETEASREDLTLVTTEKDMARLRATARCHASGIVAFPVTLAFDKEAELRQRLLQAIAATRSSSPI